MTPSRLVTHHRSIRRERGDASGIEPANLAPHLLRMLSEQRRALWGADWRCGKAHRRGQARNPTQAGVRGRLSLPGYIHRFSTANSFAMAAIGMTPQYLTEARIGLSTFEFQLTFHDQARPGDLLDVETCIAHLGNTSMRFYHRMRHAETGAHIAGLSQFGVHLNLDQRRPASIPDPIREQAQVLLANG
jgi:acyl-CoA thioesterase FadM